MDRDTKFTPAEELANAISAGAGILFSLVALVVMLRTASGQGTLHLVCAAVFGVALIVVYTTSLFNHALPAGRAKEWFHIADLAAIYVLIAGTYTPVTLIALHGTTGTAIFVTVWGMAIVGCVRKLMAPNTFEDGVDKISVISYVVMGWLILVAPRQAFESVSTAGSLLFLGGGVLYTTGVLFFRMRRLRHHHLIWHLFVIAGSALQVIATDRYVLTIALP